MLSDFQKKKIEKLFHVYDIDGSNALEEKDYLVVVEGIRILCLQEKTAPAIVALNQLFAENWQALKVMADSNSDGKITLDEWLAHTGQQLATKAGYRKVAGNMADILFDLFVRDGNEHFCKGEYLDFCWVYRLRGFSAEKNFETLCPNRSGLSKAEFGQIVREFFGDDPKAPGNNLFGPV